MSWECLYFFEYAWLDIRTVIVEVKRTDVNVAKPSERFYWFRLYTSSQHSLPSCWRLRFLAQGKTVDGDEYRILEDGGEKKLYHFNDIALTLPDRVTLLRKDPKTLPQDLRARIDQFFLT